MLWACRTDELSLHGLASAPVRRSPDRPRARAVRLPVEKDVLEADVSGDRSQVIAAGQEVINGRLLRHLVDAAVVLAGDPGGMSLPQLADRQRRSTRP